MKGIYEKIAGVSASVSDQPPARYSPVFAFVYIFNLIIGVGALTLPLPFSQAGYILGTGLLVVLAFMSYMTATFMIEAMATANAYVRHKSRRKQPVVEAQSHTIQSTGSKNATDYAYGGSGNYDHSGSYAQYSTSRRSASPKSPINHYSEKTPLVPPIISEGRKRVPKDEPEASSSAHTQGRNDVTSILSRNTPAEASNTAHSQDSDSSSGDESDSSQASNRNTPLVSSKMCLPSGDYEIDKKFEMGTMANMFYHPIGILLYYLAICLYLYGDLAIYLVAIPKSVVVVVCTKPPNASNTNASDVGNYVPKASCFGKHSGLNQQHAYYIFLSVVCLVLCPWTFFNLTKSKYIQLFTTVMRNVAFVLMIIIAIIKLADGHHTSPSMAELGGFSTLFGVSIYSFMCQHSLPGMVTPMRTKKNIFVLIFVDFTLILGFYLLLAYTGMFLFPHLNDLYTLNFFTQFSRDFPVGKQVLAVLGYYLALFPVFTLSTNFPIISITLRENLKALAIILLKRWRGDDPFHWAINRFLFPVLALLPTIGLAFATTNLQHLVSITGSFPGIAVQYVIPATLAFAGKYIITRKLNIKYENKYKSPFSFLAFLILVLAWTVVCVGLTIFEDAVKIKDHKF